MAFGITASMVFQAAAPMVLGSLMGGGSDAPQRGADQQVAANQAAIEETRAARAQQRQDLSPWMNSGGQANNELMRRLGLGGNGRIGSFTPKTEAQLRAEMLGQFTQTTTQAGDEPFFSGATNPNGWQINTSRNDPENQLGGISMAPYQPRTASQTTTSIDEQGLSDAVRKAFAGQGAAREGEVDPMYGSLTRKFGQQDLDTDLVYQNGLKFGMDTGVNQLNDRAASGGNYGSGAALKALTRFGNDYATTKTAGAYDRNTGEKNQIFNFLSGPSQQGQSAAAGVGAAGLGAAGAIGGYQTGIGNSQAAGIIGGANAMNGQVGQVTDAFRWNQLLNKRTGSSSYNSGAGYRSSEPYDGYNASIGM